jgi:hypothetical protein
MRGGEEERTRRRMPNNNPMRKTTSENESGKVASMSWSGRVVGREVDMGKIIDRIGIIKVRRHGDQM